MLVNISMGRLKAAIKRAAKLGREFVADLPKQRLSRSVIVRGQQQSAGRQF